MKRPPVSKARREAVQDIVSKGVTALRIKITRENAVLLRAKDVDRLLYDLEILLSERIAEILDK